MTGVESIGQLAQRTGTSRRMLRHWEKQGLLTPAVVDQWTKERRYASAQAGRVRAIAALRALGFGLDAIRDLLAQGLSESRLIDLLRQREVELTDRIAQDSAALAQVQTRMRSIQRERNTVMTTLALSSLPEVKLLGVTETVMDETEIPDAVGRLLTLMNVDTEALTQDVFLMYDGTTDPRVIVVSAGVGGEASEAKMERITLPSSEQAAVVTLDERPHNTADAWIALDAELEAKGLRATGPYRQVLHTTGAVTLATPATADIECT